MFSFAFFSLSLSLSLSFYLFVSILLSSSYIAFTTENLPSSSCFLCSCFRWLIFKLEFNPPMIPPFQPPSSMFYGVVSELLLLVLPLLMFLLLMLVSVSLVAGWFQHTWRGESLGTSATGATGVIAYTSIKSVSLADANICFATTLFVRWPIQLPYSSFSGRKREWPSNCGFMESAKPSGQRAATRIIWTTRGKDDGLTFAKSIKIEEERKPMFEISYDCSIFERKRIF